MTPEYDENHPETIKAKAEAERLVLEARAQLHPVAQVVHTFFESAGNAIASIGCMLIIGIAIVLLLAPNLIPSLLGR